MEEQDLYLRTRKDQIDAKIAAGLRSLSEGKGVDGEVVLDRLEAELDTLERRGHK